MDQLALQEVADLYEAVGWSVYSAEPQLLFEAVQRSTFWVSARDDGALVGLARCLSDDFSIFYLQDVLVLPANQRNGIGSGLLHRCLSRFDHVRQRVLLTDDEEHQHRLYRSAGYQDVATLRNTGLHAFVNIKGVDLT